ncbi:tripartite tricarboxylate transporter substrate-binding protein [Pseudonocardia nematodicida]|uniref:Tripartite tricarboxylate transporter substrate-binding protein n=1 Tax=Pseudonocardia nematodicida TaxID=1206997 RepID=A0ABV1KJP6_9PSEU
MDRTTTRRRASLLALLLVAALLAAGCGAGGADDQVRGLRMLVPNSPGGGFDVTARSAARALEDTGLTGPVEVFNLPGAGGVAGVGRLVGEAGDDRLLMSMGLGVVGAVASHGAPVTLADTTPIARLVSESEIVVVRSDAPYRDVHDLVDAWRADPDAVTVGGGSTPGGPDHLTTMALAGGVGLDESGVRYVSHDGGGALLAALLGGEVDAAVSGTGEFADQIASGALRVLAVTDDDRVPGLDAPTLQETGIDVVSTNWRGLVAPPGLSPQAREELVAVVARLRGSPEWAEVLRTNGWQDAWLPGDEFGAFVTAETTRVERVLTELGHDREAGDG